MFLCLVPLPGMDMTRESKPNKKLERKKPKVSANSIL